MCIPACGDPMYCNIMSKYCEVSDRIARQSNPEIVKSHVWLVIRGTCFALKLTDAKGASQYAMTKVETDHQGNRKS
jgi:hypothetical protein